MADVTLLVASAGGHLDELRRLLPRLGVRGPTIWATYDTDQARSSLHGEHVIGLHHPTTRHLLNGLRNYRLARRVLREHSVRRIISTGAAPAVSFMLAAPRQAVTCHYIESSTRVRSPSLSGRILEHLPGVRRYSQHGPFNRRWLAGPSVFDGFHAGSPAGGHGVHEPGASGPRRVLVSLGRHDYPFPELVGRMRTLGSQNLQIVWQLGATTASTSLPGRVAQHWPAETYAAEVDSADVVVGHAGVGLALTALMLGKVPVLVPRRRRRREHADDHQVAFARELDRRGLAVVTEVEGLTRGHLERAAGLVATWDEPSPFRLAE